MLFTYSSEDILKCSTGPQIIFLSQIQVNLTHVLRYSQMFNWSSDYMFCQVLPSSLSQQYVVNGNATLHSDHLLQCCCQRRNIQISE